MMLKFEHSVTMYIVDSFYFRFNVLAVHKCKLICSEPWITLRSVYAITVLQTVSATTAIFLMYINVNIHKGNCVCSGMTLRFVNAIFM